MLEAARRFFESKIWPLGTDGYRFDSSEYGEMEDPAMPEGIFTAEGVVGKRVLEKWIN